MVNSLRLPLNPYEFEEKNARNATHPAFLHLSDFAPEPGCHSLCSFAGDTWGKIVVDFMIFYG